MKLITIGDNVVDCYLDRNEYFPGGNCVNVAVNAKRNGATRVGYIGIFATDDPASHIRKALDSEGVEFHFSREAVGVSGQPKVSLSEENDRVFVGGPKDTVQHRFKIKLIPEELEYIKEYDVCHVSCYSSMESELATIAEEIKISYDFSNRKDIEYISSIAPYISYAYFSAAELSEKELDEFIGKLAPFNFEIIGLSRGGSPALFVYQNEIYKQKLRTIDVVDTMGAGDSLIAGFLTEFINSGDIETAIEKGTLSAERTCREFGGFGYPKQIE